MRFFLNSLGYSAVDLLVTITNTAILAAIAIPQYRELRISFARDSLVKQLEFDIRRVKAEAVSRGARGVISLGANGRSYTAGVDILPFANPPAADIVLRQMDLPPGTSATTASNRIVFDSRGFMVDDSGQPITGTIDFRYNNALFAKGTVYSTGVFLIRTWATG